MPLHRPSSALVAMNGEISTTDADEWRALAGLATETAHFMDATGSGSWQSLGNSAWRVEMMDSAAMNQSGASAVSMRYAQYDQHRSVEAGSDGEPDSEPPSADASTPPNAFDTALRPGSGSESAAEADAIGVTAAQQPFWSIVTPESASEQHPQADWLARPPTVGGRPMTSAAFRMPQKQVGFQGFRVSCRTACRFAAYHIVLLSTSRSRLDVTNYSTD